MESLARDINITTFKTRNEKLPQLFKIGRPVLCVFYNIDGLIKELGIKDDPEEWHLFIDSFKYNVKSI